MSCAKREYALIVCLGGLFSATVGFALSVFATLLSIFISGPQRPIIETRDAAVKASTPSSQSPSPSRSLSRGKSPLRLRLFTEASSEDSSSTQTLSRLHSLVKDLPSISVSPAPTHSSFQSETSETNTLSTQASEFSIPATTTEQRGRRRLRFSGFTQLFDKRSKTSPRSALCPSSPSDPALASPASPPPPRSPSLYRERPHKALVTRVKSCPGFHHGHHHSARRSPGHSGSFPPLPLADHPLPPVPPTPASPARCRKDKEKEKEKELKEMQKSRPRTQPYAAPYFALPPDSPPGPGVLPPIAARRRPGGRRMDTV